jgi:hypothetical protein
LARASQREDKLRDSPKIWKAIGRDSQDNSLLPMISRNRKRNKTDRVYTSVVSIMFSQNSNARTSGQMISTVVTAAATSYSDMDGQKVVGRSKAEALRRT